MTIEGTAQKCKKEGYGDPVQLVLIIFVKLLLNDVFHVVNSEDFAILVQLISVK